LFRNYLYGGKIMKRFLLVILGIVLTLSLSSCASKPDSVVFNDKLLEEKVRESMNRPNGNITLEEAAAVKKLELSIDWDPNKPNNEKIQDISALKYFTNLELLDIQFHAITDISPLSGLTKLHSLGIGGNQIGNISILSNLKNLRFLSIFNCQASDYSSLKELTYLQTLFISWSTIEDLSVISDLKDLTQLYIDNTQVSDLTPISNLNLKALKLSGSKVTDYTPILKIYPSLKEKDFELPN